jgi:hypothetical protein
MSKTNVPKPLFKSKLRSLVPRTALTELENAGNNRQDQIDEMLTPPAGNEVTNARDYASVLRDRLRYAGKAQGNVVITGLEVSASSPAAMTVDYSSGYAVVDGVLCSVTGGTSGTLTAPTNKRWAVVVLNSDNSISIELGNDSNDRVLPSIASSQRPLALIDLQSTTTEITDSEITDISEQGCYVDGHWYFSIQDAIGYVNDRDNYIDAGRITINKGLYFESVDLSGLNKIWLDFQPGAILYRVDDSSYCIKSINTVSNETTGIKITGADLRGNGKAGVIELLKFDYTDEFKIIGCRFDGNDSSTAIYKNWVIDHGDNFVLDQNWNLDNSGNQDYSTTNIDNSTNYIEDGYQKSDVKFVGTTSQKAVSLKYGWSELTAMDDRFLRVDKDAAGGTGGTGDGSHNHQWLKTYSGGYNTETWQADGTTKQNPLELTSAGLTNYTLVGRGGYDQDLYTKKENGPAYYTLIALIHR